MDWATFWTAVGGSAPVVTGGVAWLRSFLKRVVAAESKAANSPLEEKVTKVASDVVTLATDVGVIKAQFGPNGGGIRQAVNEIAIEVGVLKQTVADVKAAQKAS